MNNFPFLNIFFSLFSDFYWHKYNHNHSRDPREGLLIIHDSQFGSGSAHILLACVGLWVLWSPGQTLPAGQGGGLNLINVVCIINQLLYIYQQTLPFTVPLKIQCSIMWCVKPGLTCNFYLLAHWTGYMWRTKNLFTTCNSNSVNTHQYKHSLLLCFLLVFLKNLVSTFFLLA